MVLMDSSSAKHSISSGKYEWNVRASSLSNKGKVFRSILLISGQGTWTRVMLPGGTITKGFTL
jgi:hypothetical protein